MIVTRARRRELADYAYNSWREEAEEQIKGLKLYVKNGLVKFEDVEELGYEIKNFMNTAEEWDEGDYLYDFSVEAEDMLSELSISLG